MTKIVKFTVYSLVAVLMPACGPDGPVGDGPSPEEMTSQFNAQVAEAVGTQHAEATLIAFIAQQTVDAALALTAAAGGEVIPPASDATSTSEDTPPADVPPTDIPTNTPEPSATETLAPTATYPADDPAVTLGNPDFRDRFDNDNNWSEYDASGSKAEIKNGQLVYTKKVIAGRSRWTVSWHKIENYYLEVSAQTSGACSGYDRYGFIFRAPEPNAGLLLMVSCNGSYRIAKWDGSDMVFLVEWTHSNEINAGPNQTNRIGVMAQGSTIKVYINGKEITTVMDNDYVGEYRFGLLVGGGDSEPFVVKYDDLAYWLLP